MKSKVCLVFLLFFTLSFTVYAQGNKVSTSVSYILVPYRVKNLWGFSDQFGNIKIKPIYDSIEKNQYYWTDGAAFKNLMVVTKGNQKFVINHLNQVVVPVAKSFDDFDLDSYCYEAVIAKKNNKKALYYDGKELLPCTYDYIERISNRSFKITTNNKTGLINSSGKVIVPVKFAILGFKDFKADKIVWRARNDFKTEGEVFEDKNINDTIPKDHSLGSTTLRSTYDLAKSKTDGVIRLNLDSAFLFLKPDYQNLKADEEHPHLIYFEKKGKKGLYNAILRKIVLPCEYDEIKVNHDWNAEIIILVRKGLLGVIGEWGNVIVPPIFDTIYGKQLPFTLVKGKQVGMLTSSIHYVKPIYKSVKYSESVYDLKAQSAFGLFEVETLTGKKGMINDKGFEYFKD